MAPDIQKYQPLLLINTITEVTSLLVAYRTPPHPHTTKTIKRGCSSPALKNAVHTICPPPTDKPPIKPTENRKQIRIPITNTLATTNSTQANQQYHRARKYFLHHIPQYCPQLTTQAYNFNQTFFTSSFQQKKYLFSRSRLTITLTITTNHFDQQHLPQQLTWICLCLFQKLQTKISATNTQRLSLVPMPKQWLSTTLWYWCLNVDTWSPFWFGVSLGLVPIIVNCGCWFNSRPTSNTDTQIIRMSQTMERWHLMYFGNFKVLIRYHLYHLHPLETGLTWSWILITKCRTMSSRTLLG